MGAKTQSKLKANMQSNMKEGLDARSDVFGDTQKAAKLNAPEYTDKKVALSHCLRS